MLFAAQPAGVEVQRRSFQLRRSLVLMRRIVLPMREVVNALMRRESDAVHVDMYPYFQDVYDHVLRATEWTESLRDLVTTILETTLTIQSNRMNVITKKVTSWAAIIAVPTFVTGFYGMNVPYPGFSGHGGLDRLGRRHPDSSGGAVDGVQAQGLVVVAPACAAAAKGAAARGARRLRRVARRVRSGGGGQLPRWLVQPAAPQLARARSWSARSRRVGRGSTSPCSSSASRPPLAPVALVAHLLGRSGEGLAAIGVDLSSPRRDTLRGVVLAAAIGSVGLAFYLVAYHLGVNRIVVPGQLPDVWWRIPILVLSAAQNGLLEEVLVAGYLLHRLDQLGWSRDKALVTSALLRGSYHLYQGLGGFVGNVAMGLIFGRLYQRWGRVAPLVVAHTLIDVVAFVGYVELVGHVSWLPG